MKENWFLLGDIHGEAGSIEYFYRQNRDRLKLDECINYMILLGDVGCNYAITGKGIQTLRKVYQDFRLHLSFFEEIMKQGCRT